MASKINWTTEEEDLLRELKEERGISSWKKIATIMNQSEKEYFKTAKQYRDRYVNYIRFNDNFPKITDWSEKEEVFFLEKYFEYGAKWVQISLEMEGRSENNLKNKFYGLMRKVTRRIQKFEKNLKPKPKKFINEKYITRALDECRKFVQGKSFPNFNLQEIELSPKEINKKLTKFLASISEDMPDSDIQEVVFILRRINSVPNKLCSENRTNSTNLESNLISEYSKENNKMFELVQEESHEEQNFNEVLTSLEGCREEIGKRSGYEKMENFMEFEEKEEKRDLLEELCLTMELGVEWPTISLLD